MSETTIYADDDREGMGGIVQCAKCGDSFDNWEEGFFFPAGDCQQMPAMHEDKHFCDDCGYDIAKRYGWF